MATWKPIISFSYSCLLRQGRFIFRNWFILTIRMWIPVDDRLMQWSWRGRRWSFNIGTWLVLGELLQLIAFKIAAYLSMISYTINAFIKLLHSLFRLLDSVPVSYSCKGLSSVSISLNKKPFINNTQFWANIGLFCSVHLHLEPLGIQIHAYQDRPQRPIRSMVQKVSHTHSPGLISPSKQCFGCFCLFVLPKLCHSGATMQRLGKFLGLYTSHHLAAFSATWQLTYLKFCVPCSWALYSLIIWLPKDSLQVWN